jgi:segregation and condensation protein B
MSDALVSEDKMDPVDQSDEYEVVEDELEDSDDAGGDSAEAELSDADEEYESAEDSGDETAGETAAASGEAPSAEELDGADLEDADLEDADLGDDDWGDEFEPPSEAEVLAAEALAAEALAAGSPEAGSPEAGPSDEEDEDRRGPGPGADLSDEQIAERLYALLFASPEPLSVGKLVGLLERPPAARIRAALETIGHQLESGPLPYQLRGLKGGYTLMTVPEMGEVVGRLAKGAAVERISPAALETLAIVAYRQPVTKAEIEAIRGVQAGPILRSLVDRALVRVTGRADVPGHPLQYGTTKDFLDRFGLMGLSDLPRDAELAKD